VKGAGVGALSRIIWHPTNPDIFAVTNGPKNENLALVSISVVTERLQTNSVEDATLLWSGAGVSNFKWHSDVITDICFSPDGSCLGSCSDDGHVLLWSVANKTLSRDFIPFQNDPVSSVSFCLAQG